MKPVPNWCKSNAPLLMFGLFALMDAAAIFLSGYLSTSVRLVFGGDFNPMIYWALCPYIAAFIVTFALVGLYPGILTSPPDELKKVTQATTVVFLTLAAAVFMSKRGAMYSRIIFMMGWFLSIIFIPVLRSVVRRICHRYDWWGYPAVILGAGETGSIVAGTLRSRYRLGLKPVVMLDDDPEKIGTMVEGVPVKGPLHLAPGKAQKYKNAVAILAIPGASKERLVEVLEKHVGGFLRVVLIPDLFGMSSLWISAFDFGGILGLDLRQKLLDPRRQMVKRVMELVLIFIFTPLLIPLLLLIGVAVKLDSRGGMFYGHTRIGLGGRDIKIWKFRTMVQDADRVLEEYLEKDPAMRKEWEENHKLFNDPRITRVGRFLRKTSLDELPQLWNVLWGGLSLVGPRPIVWKEVDKYQAGFELYKKVKPGLTGLWQISGRSDTTYDDRVNLDSYYVRNWSVWFDIYILAKTPSEVFKCRGAC